MLGGRHEQLDPVETQLRRRRAPRAPKLCQGRRRPSPRRPAQRSRKNTSRCLAERRACHVGAEIRDEPNHDRRLSEGRCHRGVPVNCARICRCEVVRCVQQVWICGASVQSKSRRWQTCRSNQCLSLKGHPRPPSHSPPRRRPWDRCEKFWFSARSPPNCKTLPAMLRQRSSAPCWQTHPTRRLTWWHSIVLPAMLSGLPACCTTPCRLRPPQLVAMRWRKTWRPWLPRSLPSASMRRMWFTLPAREKRH